MAALQSTGAISINDVAGVMGGSAPHSLSEYYRGGGLVPSTRTTNTRSPTSGYNISWDSGGGEPNYYFNETSDGNESAITVVYWQGEVYVTLAGWAVTSYTVGNTTYYKGPFYGNAGFGFLYEIYKIATTTTNINANVPASGAISMSNFYSAEKP